jgi:hypothetical protein
MKKFLVIAVLFTVIVTGAFAQAGAITDYMFGLPGGNFMETQWYVYSGIEKFYIQAGLDNANLAKLGFAAKTGGLYIGVSYNGSIFNQYDWGYTENQITFAGVDDKTIEQYVDPGNNVGNGVNHNLGILIGVAEMGFKLGFSSSYQILYIDKDARVGTIDYKSYKNEYGDLSPSIKWGMARDLTDKGIRPSVYLGFTFHVDQQETDRYYQIGATTNYASGGKAVSGRNGFGTNNYINFSLAINLGGYKLISQENGFEFAIDLDYSLDSRSYDENQQSYRFTPIGGTASIFTFKEKGTFSSANNFRTDYVNARHYIQPEFKAQWSSDRVGLGAKLHLPITIETTEYQNNTIRSGANFVDPGLPTGTGVSSAYKLYKASVEKDNTVSFRPRIQLGGQYKLVPDKFNINMGATIGLSAVSHRTQETKTTNYITPIDPGNGPQVDKETIQTIVTPSTTGTSSNFSVGTSLFLTKNVILDAETGVMSRNNLNFFGTGAGSITYFTSLLLMLSF